MHSARTPSVLVITTNLIIQSLIKPNQQDNVFVGRFVVVAYWYGAAGWWFAILKRRYRAQPL
jgi:hypothetical protein